MKLVKALRALEGGRRGSSRPIVVETELGACLVKLRGAAQGTAPLVAEIIVGAIADALGLLVPERVLVELTSDVDVPVRDAELRDLMAASVGVNLGFAYLEGARDFVPADVDGVSVADRAAIFWLDRFVMNPDRNNSNTNLMWWNDDLWLIDHGAALGFHYDWSAVSEASPSREFAESEPHLFAPFLTVAEVLARDEELAARITRDVLEAAADDVPDDFLLPLLGGKAALVDVGTALRRRRAAYTAFLWKRLKSPRSFADPRLLPVPRPARRGVPAWLRRR